MPTPIHDPYCPFCSISSKYPAISPLSSPNAAEFSAVISHSDQSSPSYVLLSTPHVVAFLDIMPLTRGHVLVIPRRHATKMGDLSPEEGCQLGRLLPLISRSVVRAVLPDIPVEHADYNIVQNNGPGAAQVVPHLHYHIIPRPPLDYQYHQPSSSASSSPPPTTTTTTTNPDRPTPSGKQMQRAIFFGRGQRTDLDDDEAEELIHVMRKEVAREWRRTFPEGTRLANPGREGQEREKL